MAIKKNPTPTVKPTVKAATKPFMAPGFNLPSGVKSKSIGLPAKQSGTASKKKVSTGKGIDLAKDKMRARVQKTKMKIRSSTVSRGSANCGIGNNLCKSKSKF